MNGTLIGEAVLYNFDYRGSAELGCRIDKAYAGNGYGTEAFPGIYQNRHKEHHLQKVAQVPHTNNFL